MQIRWRGLELPTMVRLDTDTANETYGLFVVEPFERGFGVTVGNSLRRVLLSSLEGSAVTQIKVRGAQHEFTTIPGVLEDMTDIAADAVAFVMQGIREQINIVTSFGDEIQELFSDPEDYIINKVESALDRFW